MATDPVFADGGEDLLVQDILLTDQPFARVPLVNFVEEGDKYLLTAELPGIQKSDVTLEMNSERGTLELKAEKSDTKDVNEDSFRVHESMSSSFCRSLKLPDDGNDEVYVCACRSQICVIYICMRCTDVCIHIYAVDMTAIPPAEFKDGIISVSLPRKHEAEQKKNVQQIAIQ
jgi:HSP20 family molecular chaperone IbpA